MNGYARRVDREMLAEAAPRPTATADLRLPPDGLRQGRRRRARRARARRPQDPTEHFGAERGHRNERTKTRTGNAAADLLDKMFQVEATDMVTKACGGLGADGPIGAAMAYADRVGRQLHALAFAVFTMLIQFTDARDRVVLDMRGTATLSVTV